MKAPVSIRSNLLIPLILFLVFILLVLFGFFLARRQTAPPSEGISREIPIGELDYGFSKTINCHTHALEHPGTGTITVLAVDGSGTRLIDLNGEGELLNGRRLDLDLSQSSLIEVFYIDSESIRVFYLRSGKLIRVDIDLSVGIEDAAGRFSESVLTTDVRSFSTNGGDPVYSRDDGLFAYRKDFPVRLLPAGDILSFKIVERDEELFVLAVEKTDWDRVDLHLLRCDRQFTVLNDWIVLKDGPLKFYHDLKDLHVDDDSLTALYSYRNKHDKLNTLTVQTIEPSRGSLEDEIRNDFPYYNSRYSIVDAEEERVRFLLQFDGIHSVDLGLCTMEKNGSYMVRPLTRTRNVSKLTGFFTQDGRDVLVFTDLEYEKRILHLASGTERMMEETTRLSFISLVSIMLTTILVFLVSLVSGVLFLMFVMPFPFAVALVLDRTQCIKGVVGFSLLTVAGAAVHTGLQILVTMNILHSRIDTGYFPVFAGQGPWIYVILILVALISYAAVQKDMEGIEYGSRSLMLFYVRFAVYGYLVYSPLFLMYVFNAVLLSKI